MHVIMSVLSSIMGVLLTMLVLVVVAVMVMMLATYHHDDMLSKASTLKAMIKRFRKERYTSVMNMVQSCSGRISSQTLGDMRGMMARYVSIKDEQVEIEWEHSWIPKMRKLSGMVSKVSGGAKLVESFEKNETELSSARDELCDIEGSIARFEGNKAAMLCVRGFYMLSEKVKRLPDFMNDAKDKARESVSSAKSSIDDKAYNMTPDVTHDAYGTHTYFDADKDANSGSSAPQATSGANGAKPSNIAPSRNASRTRTSGGVRNSTSYKVYDNSVTRTNRSSRGEK